MTRIIFICTGNTCRSPMAHYYAQSVINKRFNPENYYIESAGINAYKGVGATKNAIDVMEQYNIDISNHRSNTLENSLIENADYIIGMTQLHKNILMQIYPNLKNKIFTLKEVACNTRDGYDIDDPWGYGIEVYSEIAKQIIENVDKFLERI